MGYIIYARHSKYLEILRRILSRNGFFILDTEFKECVIVVKDPTSYIPSEIRKYVQVAEAKDYARFIKGFNSLVPLLNPSLTLKEGDPVRIKKEPYDELTGIVRKIGKKMVEVEVSVFGRIVRERFRLEDVERIEQNF